MGEDFYQTIKGKGSKERIEYEAQIFKGTFSIFYPLCKDNSIRKLRYEMPSENKNHTIYLDIYKNDFKGLFTAEVEFETIEDCDKYTPESWFGKEVTEDYRYANVNLAKDGLPKNHKS